MHTQLKKKTPTPFGMGVSSSFIELDFSLGLSQD